MFGKNKTYTADEILGLIAALPEEEKEKVRASISGGEQTPVEDGTETSPPEENPAEESEEKSEETPAEDPVPPEGNDTGGEEPPENLAPEETKAPENEAMQALAARVEALEQKLEELIEKQTEAVNAEENADFGEYTSSAPDTPAEDDERYDAVMRGYAGRNAKKY